MNKERDEKLLKSWLKKKITITAGTVVAFLITGSIVNTPIYGAVNIGSTNGDTISKNNADGSGISVGEGAKTNDSLDISIGKDAGKDSSVSSSRSVAIGANSRVGDTGSVVNQSIAIGGGTLQNQGAWAKGDQSISIGGNTRSDGHSSVAIGGDDLDKVATQEISYVNAEDKRVTGNIKDAMQNLTGINILSPQYSNTMSGHGAVALGVKAVAGHLSLAIGTAATAGAIGTNENIEYKAVNTVAIGSGATAMLDNAIAIGGGAKADGTRPGTKQTGAKIKSIEYTWNGGDKIAAGDIVSFGAEGFERQLKNVAPGEVSANSTDGINGSQLFGIAKNITSENHLKYLGDDAQNDETKIVNLSLEKNKLNIVGEADTTKLSDANIGVVYESGNNKAANGKDLETDNPAYQEGKLKIKLSKELKNLKSAEFKTDTGDKTVINGDGVTITPVANGKKPVSVTKNGLNNGGNVIANVAGNLEGAKPNSTVPTTKAAAPINVDDIKNNAATVGDVLQAGWNLQNNSEERDFVKPYDTVNFEDGNGTTAVVDTDNTTSTVKYNVNLGNGLEKNSANKITIKPADKSLEVNKAGVKVKTDGTTITTGDSGLTVVTGEIEPVTTGTNLGTVKVTDGDAGKIATVDSVVKAVNNAAFTLKASADGGTLNANSTAKATGELIKAGNTIEMIAGKNLEVKHNKNGKITFATVENPSFETVQIGDGGPKFSATSGGNISVSDKDGTNPVKITNVKDGDITKTSKDAINGSQFHAVAKNTIKLAGQNGTDTAIETAGQELDKKDGIKFTIKSSDGKLLDITADANGDTITITPKTGTITTKGGVPTATTTNGKLVTADEVVNALTEMGWKATAGTDGTGTMIGTGATEELIKAGNTVTFKAGDNLAIKQAGKNFIYSLNPELSGLTSAEFKNTAGDVTTINGDGVTITPVANGKKPVSVTKNGLNNGGNVIANVAGNLEGAKPNSTVPTTKAAAPINVDDIKNNAATVGDVLQAGWNLQNNSEEKDFVKPYDTVNFANGDGTTATVETTNNKVSTVKYSVNLGDGLKKDDTGNTISIKPADKSLEVNKDGLKVKTDDTTITTDDNKGLKVVTGTIESVTTGNDSGTVKVKEGDTGKIATVDSVVNAVNSAAFTLKASATTGGTRNGSSSVGVDGEDIKAGKTIEMIAGKNLNVTHNENGKIIFATVDTPTFSTVQVGGDQGPKFSKTSDGDIKVSDKDGANPVKVTNVKDGAVTDTSTDAINGSQFHKVANNTIKLAGQNGDDATTATQTKEQNLNKQGGIKFTIKSSDGKLLEVKAADDTITLTPKTATITTGEDGIPTANIDSGKLVTAEDLVTALKNMGWKAIAGQEGSGTVAGNAEQLIKAGETVTFKAGNNLAVKQAGKEFIYSLKQELTDLTKVEVKDTAGNSVVTTPTETTITAKDATDPTKNITTVINAGGTTVTDKDGNTTKVDGNGLTITPKDTTKKPVSVTKDGINAGDKAITNVASNLTNYDSGNKKGLVDLSKIDTTPNSNVATVGDLRNMGWVVSSDKTTGNLTVPFSAQVKNANEVEFIGKNNAVVSATTDGKGKHTVTVDVTVPSVEKGTINAVTVGGDKGKVVANTGDGDKFTTVDTVVSAINSAAWKATSGKEGTGAEATGHIKSDAEIKAGDTVTFKAGDNLKIKQDDKNFIYSLNPELTDLSKVEVKDAAGNSVVTTPTGTTITAKDTTDPTKNITTVINAGGTTVTDKDGNTTKVDGNGITITPKNDPANPANDKNPVKLTKDGLNNGGNTITNVAGNLEGAKKDTNSPTNKADAPNNVDNIKNNAATVGDVLNAGWNLQNNGDARDFVKPYDTVNFVDGLNTKAIVTTDAAGKVSNVQIDVKDLPIAYTNEAGDKVVKAADGKYYKESDLAGKVYDPTANTFKNANGTAATQPTEVAKDSIKTNLVNPNAAENKAGDPSTLGNVKSGLDTIKDANGGTTPSATDKTAGLVNLSEKDPATNNLKVSDNNVATVGDLRNMGWVVSSDKTTNGTGEYSEQVKNANEVRFVGKGTATVSGKTVDGVRTITVDVNDQVSTNNSVTPVVYTKADGTQVYPIKQADGTTKFNTKPDGTGTEVPKTDVITSVNGPEGTTSPTTLKNVKGNLPQVNDKDKTVFDPKTGTTKQADDKNTTKAPITAAEAADIVKNAGNNAATVGDVLNAGWNLQNNGTAKDFVKPYDTVNFVDGLNTKAIVTTDADGKVGNVQIDVKDLPMAYTNEAGDKVVKAADGKYYKESDLAGKVYDPTANTFKNANGTAATQPTEVAKDSIKTNLVNPNAAENKAGDPSTLGNVKSGLDTIKAAENKVAAGLVNLTNDKVSDNNVATVGDLRNMGWVVSTSDTGYNDQVRNANKVDFKQGTGIKISGETTADGTRQITIGLDTGKVTNEVTITKPNGEKVNAIKVTQPDGTVKYYEKDKDGKADLKNEVSVGTGANDNKVTADDGSRVVTGNAVATAIGESGWNVGKANVKDVTKAFETEAKLHDKVNPNDDVKFVDGDNTTVSMVTIDSKDENGTKKATTYIKTDINKDIHIDSVTTGGKNADGTPGKDGALTVKDKNGNDRVKVVPNGMTITPNKADGTPDPDKAVSLTDKGLNNGGNNITNVKSNLPQVNDSAKKAYDVNGNPIANKNNTAAPITAADAADIMKKAGNNAATVGDVLNAGWNLQENGSDRDFVKPYDTVNFVDGTNTKVTVKTNEDGTKSNVQVNIVGLPIAFADKDGNRVVQGVKDNKIVYYKMLSDGTASKEIVDPKNVQVTNVNPTDAKINTVGTPGATINNVAPAEVSPTSTQAVNGSQLYQVAQEINNVNNKVDKLGDRVNKGLAGAAAMSGIEFMEIGINQATVAAAVGGYRGTHAVAVGVQAAPTENTRVNAKASLTPGARTESMYSVGASYRFNWK
ncbi:YadA-like family protein [Fusobacterium massiliense]|uniref:YadA-like family protein n=1 Tax=Fusobacterium massiliense TaxID=1852365 RepID=UPI0028EBBBF4|nr:YadA-like family protein [Fusobacterium massiliense]